MPAGWVSAAAAVAGVASSALSKGGQSTSTQNVNSSSTQTPADISKGYIQNQFAGAQNNLINQQAQGPFQGQLNAPSTAGEQAAAQQATAYGNGAGQNLIQSGATGLASLYGNAGTYGTNATNLAANGTAAANAGDMATLNGYGSGTQQASLVNGGLSDALNTSATAGTGAINNALTTLGSNSKTALQDPTQQINNDASAYMNNPGLAAQEASTNAGIANTLNETTLPGINQSAAMGGSLNSSRAGAANAEAQGQAALAEGSADASLINNAYNTGVGTATNTYENGLNTSNSAATSAANAGLGTASTTANLQNNEGQFNATTQLGAANSGITQQLASEGLNANTQLSANAQLGQGVFDAALGTGNVQNGATTNQALSGAAGTLQQSDNQIADTNAAQQFANNTTYNDNALTTYATLVDNPSYTDTTGVNNQASTTPGAGYVGTALGTYAGINGLTGDADGSDTALSNTAAGIGQYFNPPGALGGATGDGSEVAHQGGTTSAYFS